MGVGQLRGMKAAAKKAVLPGTLRLGRRRGPPATGRAGNR